MISSETIFVDTSAWFALADRNDNYHKKAAESYPALLKNAKKLFTSNLVISETYTLIREELGHQPALAFITSITASPRIKILYSDEEIEKEAATLLKKYYDQHFSYSDAISFIFMRKLKIKKAFSFDKHFLIAGFTLIP